MASISSLRALSNNLLQACRQGSLPTVRTTAAQLYSQRSASLDIVPLRLTLATSAQHGHTAIVEHLLQKYSFRYAGSHRPWDPELWFPWKSLPQEWIKAGWPDIVLESAARSGTPSTMQLLLDAGMHVDHQTDKEGPAMVFAIASGSVEMVRFLLGKGAQANDVVSPNFTTYVENAARHCSSSDMLKALHEYGAPLVGQGALYGAAQKGNIATAEFLLGKGLDVNEETQFAGGMLDDVNVGNDKMIDYRGTALHAAAEHGKTDMLRWLLERGADKDILDGHGRTAEDRAEQCNKIDIVKILRRGQ